MASHFQPPQCENENIREVWRGGVGVRMIYIRYSTKSFWKWSLDWSILTLLFSPCHLPSALYVLPIPPYPLSMNAINFPPPPIPPPSLGFSLCFTHTRRQLFPKAFSYCSYLLNTVTGEGSAHHHTANRNSCQTCRVSVWNVSTINEEIDEIVKGEKRKTMEKIYHF